MYRRGQCLSPRTGAPCANADRIVLPSLAIIAQGRDATAAGAKALRAVAPKSVEKKIVRISTEARFSEWSFRTPALLDNPEISRMHCEGLFLFFVLLRMTIEEGRVDMPFAPAQ